MRACYRPFPDGWQVERDLIKTELGCKKTNAL